MALYYQAGTFKDLDPALVAAWIAASNPKASGLVEVPAQPAYDATGETCTFDGAQWVISEKSAEQIAAEAAQRRAYMSCTPRQARLALAQSNLLEAVEAWIITQPQATQIEWYHATEIKRTWPPVVEFAVANQISDTDLDALFELAATL